LVQDLDNYETSNHNYTLTIDSTPIESSTFYQGSGLNDGVFSGTYATTSNSKYVVYNITPGSPDTFDWGDNNGGSGTGVSMTIGTPIALSSGISITFTSDTGHNNDDTFYAAYGKGYLQYNIGMETGLMENGETLIGSISGATATVVREEIGAYHILLVNNQSGPFVSGETVTGLTSGKSAVITLLSSSPLGDTFTWVDGGTSSGQYEPCHPTFGVALSGGAVVTYISQETGALVGDQWIIDVVVDVSPRVIASPTSVSMGDVGDIYNKTKLYINDTSRIIVRNGGIVDSSVSTPAYGTTETLTTDSGSHDLNFTTGTGPTTVLLPTGTNSPIGQIYIIKDLDCIASSSNITIDAGTGNFICGTAVSQTYIMSTDGECVLLKKVTVDKWSVQ
jgi:hypothetical protein